jgi:hypothetical protein
MRRRSYVVDHQRTTPISRQKPMQHHGSIVHPTVGIVADYTFTPVTLQVDIKPITCRTEASFKNFQSLVRTHYRRNYLRHKHSRIPREESAYV